MLTAKTPLKQAEGIKKYLLKNNLFDKKYQIAKEKNFIYFPLLAEKEKITSLKKKFKEIKIVRKRLKISKVNLTIRDILKKELNKKELSLLPSSFDLVGDILVLEIPKELEKKERIVAQGFLKLYKNIKTVAKKTGIHSGIYRTRKIKILAGETKKETFYRENGLVFQLHLEKAYFSPRLANERLRIASRVKAGEEVLVMFSGCAPYPLAIAKHSQARVIYGIEINPQAHHYALKNVKLNQFGNRIKLFLGDVRKIMPELSKKFDRIIMPLPKTGEEFLDLAIKFLKKNGFIHYYCFLNEGEINKEKEKIISLAKKLNKKIKIIKITKCGEYKPRVFRYCFDLKIF